MLTFRVDSINNILSSERNVFAQKEQGYTSKISNLENQITLLKSEIELINKNSSGKDLEIKNLNNELVKTKNENEKIIYRLKTMTDSIKKYTQTDLKSNKSQDNNNRFVLPYQYKKIKNPIDNGFLTTIFITDNNINYIITDSIISSINGVNQLCFYFLTPLENEINLDCPVQFGLIVLNEYGVQIFKSFWNDESTNNLGNCNTNILQFKLNDGFRNLLSFGSSACGSGATQNFYNIILTKDNINFKLAISGCCGYSDFYFIPEKNIYLKIQKENPKCHYSCPSKYKINSYVLSNDKLLKTFITKFEYEDFADIGIKNLMKKIQNKEKIDF